MEIKGRICTKNSSDIPESVWGNLARTYAFKKKRTLRYLLKNSFPKAVKDAREAGEEMDVDEADFISRHYIRAYTATDEWVDEETTLLQIMKEAGEVEVHYEVLEDE